MIRRVARWFRVHARILLPYLLVVAVACGVVAGTVYSYTRQTHERCLDRQTDRQVLRTVVDTSFSSGVSVDLTKVPGFDALDPNTQAFVKNLSANGANASPSTRRTLRDQLLDQLTPISC